MKPDRGNIILDQSVDGQANDTVWLNQAQMLVLFQRDQSVIYRHVNNVFKKRYV